MSTPAATDRAPLLPWPDAFSTLKAAIAQDWGIVGEIHLYRELKGGRSGAKLFAVDIDCAGYSGRGILKFDLPKASWGSNELSEEKRHEVAWEHAPEYLQQHGARLIKSFHSSDGLAILYEIAGNDLQNIQALAEAPHDIQEVTTRSLAIELLAKWNGDSLLGPVPVRAQSLLQRWLGYRLDPQSGGYIHDFVRSFHHLDDTVPSFTWSGSVYPNPLYFLANPTLFESVEPITPINGRVHGDLHRHNICTTLTAPGTPEYYLIDFALYEERAPLFYDQSYLEVAYLLAEGEGLGTKRWTNLVVSLATIEQEADSTNLKIESGCVGLARIIGTLRHGCRSWILRAHKSRKTSALSQYLMARVAAALNFVNKRGLQEESRARAFFCAACSLKRYFESNQLPIDDHAIPLRWGLSPAPVSHEAMDRVWESCEYFDGSRYAFILVSNLRETSTSIASLRPLSRVPWSLVVDLDADSGARGLLRECRQGMELQRGFHLAVAVPGEDLDVNLDRATLWLMARGYSERVCPPGSSLTEWRRNYAGIVREWFLRLRDKVLPKPVIMFVLSDSTEVDIETRIWEFADEALQLSLRTIWIAGKPSSTHADPTSLHIISRDELSHFGQELDFALGSERLNPAPRVPRRVNLLDGSDEILREVAPIESTALNYLEEDFQLVGSHLLTVSQTNDPRSSFLRGSEISWLELDAHVDISRDAYQSIRNAVEERLSKHGNSKLRFEHSAGAGGTTLARRLAWELKELFPVVLLLRFSRQSGDRLASLYHLTGLPILVVAESGGLSESELEDLDLQARRLNCRCTILLVARHPQPSGAFSLSDPMNALEARRFFTTYSGVVGAARKEKLSELTFNDTFRKYRSPFFYGLFSFEDEFVHVAAFVKSHLEGLIDTQRRLLDYLALIACYSQSNQLSIFEAAALGGMQGATSTHISDIVGKRAERLTIQTGTEVKIIHPTIAREVLRQLSPSVQQGELQWKGRLHEIAISLIGDLALTIGPDNDRAKELLTQLFIMRTAWADGAPRSLFAALILDMSSPESQALVFQELTKCFPGEAHFWNHRGRHSNLLLRERFEEAETLLKQAILLEPRDGLHHHALGMVYRREVQRRLQSEVRRLGPHGPRSVAVATAAVELILDVFDLAESAFDDALVLTADSNYPFVTHLQLILETLESVIELSGLSNAQALLSGSGTMSLWLAEKLSRADDLLEGLNRLDAQDAESEYSVECNSRLKGLYGDFEGMLTSLQSLLNRHDVDKVATRRLMACAVARRRNGDWIKMPQEEIRRICELSDANILAGSENWRDFLSWMRAYRKLPEFDPNVAISRMTTWAGYGSPIDAYYYLYILQFVKWYRGLSDDLIRARDALQRCYGLYGTRGRPWSYEWLSDDGSRFPVVHYNDLGPWQKGSEKPFYRRKQLVLRVPGVIVDISGPQSGFIEVRRGVDSSRQVRIPDVLRAFFIPGQDFLKGRDENAVVNFYLGFSYQGLRAWWTERGEPS